MRLRTTSTLAAATLLALAAVRIDAFPGKGHDGGPAGKGPGAARCDVNQCTVQVALDDACPCSDAVNHGQYVRCVAHALKGLVASGVTERRCRGRLVHLAAHTVCGRANDVVCLVPTSTCGDDGTCANDPNVDCVDDTDCGTGCTAMTSDACDAANGLTSDAGNCAYASCFSPSGAFLDASAGLP